VEVLVDQALLAVAVAALGVAGFRVASMVAEGVLERLIAAAVLAAAAAIAEALLLGRVGLAGSPPALAGAAVGTWVTARLAPQPPPALGRREGRRLGLVLLGAASGLVAWSWLYPFLGVDTITYHLSEAVSWVQHGSTGSVDPLIVGLPVGNYPVTNEVLIAWGLGISHSFAPVALECGGLLMLFAASAWLGLRTLEVSPILAGLAIVAVCAAPLTIGQIVQPQGDFAALAWLTACAALSLAAVRSPPLLAVAVIAAGLAIGVKTTAAPLALVVLALATWRVRGSLRRLALPLGLGFAGAVVVGGLWYVRDLVDHGSPLWPLVAGPGGDPVPPIVSKLDYSLLQRPAATLRINGLIGEYGRQFAGAILIVAAALSAPIWARRPAVRAAAAAALAALLLWANAPFTGAGHVPQLAFWPFNTLRYALPVIGAAALVLALASRAGTRARAASALTLAAALGWNLVSYARHPFLPHDAELVLAVGLGGVAGAALGGILRGRLAAVLATATAVALLTIAAHGYVERHARSGEFDAGLLRWLQTQPAWRNGSREVAVSPTVLAPLAGDRLSHRLSLIDARDSCASIARKRSGLIVVGHASPFLYPPLSVGRCLARIKPTADLGVFRVYAGP
jgi:hypothetical protein